tara:strand:- start:142 stop:2127 length:1986 start_codon:yes stop_codon:yes gene_type:complete
MNYTDGPVRNFKKLLIANRGEIAVRIIKTAKRLGLETVAVYTEADSGSLHVNYADKSICIGVGPVIDSYLNAEKIIAAAHQTESDAIHPGYGFLSENDEFASLCQKENLIFVGPSAKSIQLMANKAKAKKILIEAGVPCIPGFEVEGLISKEIEKKATDIGFPVMIKAAAGGGGRGMRLVKSKYELSESIKIAMSESQSAFGSSEIIIEKAIIAPRHVEIQVFSDNFGNCVYIGERDCSVQRKHQKIIEEAPCPVMTNDLRKKMGEVAVSVAKKIKYSGAGTVEFLLDSEDRFYFLEMNTRLQVEHPVTELISGLDLVAMQLSVADQKELKITQEDIVLDGHAIEVRLYAEDPENDFSPSTGTVELWKEPKIEGIRVDPGIKKGQTITPYYDGMLAKIIAKAETRSGALKLILESLKKTILVGVKTNRDLLIEILSNKVFVKGEGTTAFFEKAYSKGYIAKEPAFIHYAIVASMHTFYQMECNRKRSIQMPNELLGWSNQGFLKTSIKLSFFGETRDINMVVKGPDALEILNEKETLKFTMHEDKLRLNGQSLDMTDFYVSNLDLYLFTSTSSFRFRNEVHRVKYDEKRSEVNILAPMPGVIHAIDVSEGTEVFVGDRVAILEAMKMQHELIAGKDGKIGKIYFSTGEQVSADDLIMEIKE